MKRLAITAAALAIAAPAFAVVDFEAADANADDFISMPEAMAAYPDMDPTAFDTLDANQDRLLDEAEANTGEATELFAGLERAEAAEAATFDMSTFDTDADSALTYEEVSNRIPGVPEVYFQDFDLDNSGALESVEVESGAFQNLLNKYGS